MPSRTRIDFLLRLATPSGAKTVPRFGQSKLASKTLSKNEACRIAAVALLMFHDSHYGCLHGKGSSSCWGASKSKDSSRMCLPRFCAGDEDFLPLSQIWSEERRTTAASVYPLKIERSYDFSAKLRTMSSYRVAVPLNQSSSIKCEDLLPKCTVQPVMKS